MKRLAAFALSLLLAAQLAQAQSAPDDPHTPLDKWLTGLKSLRAQFTQTVKDSQGQADRSDQR